jgi:Putative transposase of IS4/5 family (DUF4096)
MRAAYPSDISKKKFEELKPLLLSVRQTTKPREICLYDTFCAVLYVLRTGCQWRALPSDFPKWSTVYSYFRKWSQVNDEGISVLELATLVAVFTPDLEVGMHCTPLGEITGQSSPLAACAQQIQYAAKHIVQVHLARRCLLARTFEQGHNGFKLLACNIAWVFSSHYESIKHHWVSKIDFEQILSNLNTDFSRHVSIWRSNYPAPLGMRLNTI